jgi:hypothetical protein
VLLVEASETSFEVPFHAKAFRENDAIEDA